ncbi:MAG: SagB/ThcOx family dehydrogenase [Methanoregulaceae archaeon]|jgi:SagB-type dehydrogenase family enzyme|nr:SagB/ThcOx family dehydrogenase [Methanoregulaceae archaeon]MCC7468987.1 SagB/ThcOx family dehydrogenase [Burkholderiaceae bacterium]NLH26157.1 SagB/ThcOx family dehydrogenase [Methanomicrobiales archaeon]HMZ31743.1 SagB/ThcOx family dehydrogenase [Methanoregulaceae archaeon]HNW80315.1 SagB/ThcOx family dehydrogenase [Methanoregulaceae archaeon]
MQPTGATFMELTQYDHLSPSDQNLKKTPPPLAKAVPKGTQYIPLPKPGAITAPPMDLRHAIETRRSLRHYRKEPISIEELSYLLWCTQGVVQVVDPFYTLRNVPSAGGRHALETYLLINRVTSLPPGLYRYVPFSHSLVAIEADLSITDKVMAACLGQAFVRSSAVTFLWSTVIYRMAWRYSERAYRLVHLDAGHTCQNLYLAAEQVGCGACAIGAFDDELMADLLGLDKKEEFVLYCAAVGKR